MAIILLITFMAASVFIGFYIFIVFMFYADIF